MRKAAHIAHRFLLAAALTSVLALVCVGTAAAGVTVSMGDSYSSGEGTRNYDGDTIDRDNKCHRGPNAWPRMFGVRRGHHMACSGATFDHLYSGQAGAPDDRGQLNWLKDIAANEQIDTVLITMGGNDIGFSSIVRSCWIGPGECLGDMNAMVGKLQAMKANAEQAYRNIYDASGARRVVVVGYPDITPGPNETACNWTTTEEVRRIDEFAGKLESTLHDAAASAGAEYVSTRNALNGHELCTSDKWVKPLLKRRIIGYKNEMGHPTYHGQVAIKDRVTSELARITGSCTARNNVSMLIDDSGSMGETDPNKLRSHALDLFLTKPGSQNRTVGAVEFGESAGRLFAPAIVSAGAGVMRAGLPLLLDDGFDNDGNRTNYNAAFDASATNSPQADARVFLTDGEHNEGLYEDGHLGGPPTFVIGLGIGPAGQGSPEADLLARIAFETGGAYFPLIRKPGDSAAKQLQRLQSVVNEVDARLACDNVPRQVQQTLSRKRPAGRQITTPFLQGNAIEIVPTWANPAVDVDIQSICARTSRGTVIADALGRKRIRKRSRKRRAKLDITVNEGATFDTVTVMRPASAARLSFRAKILGQRVTVPVTVQSRPINWVAPTTPPPAPVTPKPPAPPAAPKPYAGNLKVVVYGGGHVGVSFDVGWQAGRDPVTCHFFRDGVEVFTAQCGTSSSKQFSGVPAGTHSFYATVSDRFGVFSDPTNTVVVNTS